MQKSFTAEFDDRMYAQGRVVLETKCCIENSYHFDPEARDNQ
jgi:hypothetical protein